jgi:hypothetical protein
MSKHLASIAFIARSESRVLMMALARDLKQRHGSTFHLYCTGAQEVLHYQRLNQDGLFDTINDIEAPVVGAVRAEVDEAAVFARARDIEAFTGLTVNRMVVADRHFGRGYSLGGFYHPRSRNSETVDYVHMVHAYNELLDYWRGEMQSKGITLCLNGTREAAYVAHAMGLPYRSLAGSRYGNYHYWAWNELYENPLIEPAWHRVTDVSDIDFKAPYYTHQVSRSIFKKKFSLRALAHGLALTTARYAYWNLRGYKKAKQYYWSSTMYFLWRVWLDYRRLHRMRLKRLTDLAGKKFVYFPLHVEPETALHGISPEYFYQHALIAAVSRDLPAGVYLAVKEAYGAIGRRPDTFYRQLADLKNVVLLDVWEVGFDAAQTADAVVTICGTAAIEATAAGKPVIAFGRRNIYNFLPSVTVVEDETELPGMLAKALDGTHDRDATKHQALRFLKAVKTISFDLGQYDYVQLDRFESEAVSAAADGLEQSLDAIDQAPVARAV